MVDQIKREPKTMKVEITVDVREDPLFMLHEQVVEGHYRGTPAKLNRAVGGDTQYIEYMGKNYVFKLTDVMIAILNKVHKDEPKK